VDAFAGHRQRRLAGALFFLGAAQFWLVDTFAEATYPSYSVHTQALSDLGAVGSPTGFAWDPSLFLLGVCWLAAVVLVFRRADRKWLLLNLVPGIATATVALVPEYSISAVHFLAAYTTFISGAVAAVVDARLFRSPFRYFSLALGVFSLAVIGGGSVLGSGALGFGGAERLVAYPIIAWVMGLGAYLMATEALRPAVGAGTRAVSSTASPGTPEHPEP
jgi:hypothetical membrane protein